jgi:predicted acetyltransferase
MTFADAPIDPTSAERLKAQQLRLALVDTSDRAAFTAWYEADARGFYGPRFTNEKVLDEQLERAEYRRTTGVFDESAAEPQVPVATVATWPTPMTVPGDRSVEAWAISSVTVAPTHRRRGVARSLLEAELRTAHALGVPLAALTVSEATIYARYGFGPATWAHDLSIETRRVRWVGPETFGRVHFVSLESLDRDGRDMYRRARAAGDIELDELLWQRLVGVIADQDDQAKHLRGIRYDDPDGRPQGFAVYRVTEHDSDFTKHAVAVKYLCAATDGAYAALWRFLFELDLVGEVTADLRAVDEPFVWQVGDQRAVQVRSRREHLWVRLLDVKAALEARRYSAQGRIVLDVTDELGMAAGRWHVAIDGSGDAVVDAADPSGDDVVAGAPEVAHLALSVADLSSLYLGGVSASTLVRAGRVREVTPGAADAFDASFRTARAPWLSTWF